jgi:asparagine synthase (glutamine-hydrolysing)
MFNTTHKEIFITHKDFIDNLENIIWCRDLPVSEASDIPIYIMSRFASQDIKVVLSGEGGDELLGGYYKYFIEHYSKYFRVLPSALKKFLYNSLKAAHFNFKNTLNHIETAGIKNDLLRFFMWFSSLSQDKIYEVLNKDFLSALNLPPDLEGTLELLGYKDFEAVSYLDVKYWLPDNLLERADRLTMASSQELRAPFLDHNLVEFCFSLPEKEKMKGLLTKVILKKAMRNKLPKSILQRTKIGFSTPFKHWVRKELTTWVSDIIFSGSLKKKGIFNQAALDKIFQDHISGRADNAKIIWTVVNFELWYNKYFN